jgi:uncharacterized protein YciI
MKHFLIEIQYQVPAEQLGETVSEHRAFLQTGYDQGMLLFSGLQNPRTGGIVIARAESLEALQTFFAADPYQKKQLATYRWIEFQPVKYQDFLKDWISS